jgi:uncharacterized protein (DUF433 family)
MRPQEVVHSDPEIMGGEPVFVGTRVPFKTLFEANAPKSSPRSMLSKSAESSKSAPCRILTISTN